MAGTVSASPTGNIAGRIVDPSGAVVPNAALTLTNLATNSIFKSVSDAYGAFQFLQLAPAVYRLSVEVEGFKKSTAESVLVEVDQITRVDIALQLGTREEIVHATSATPLLEPDKSTLSSVVSNRLVSTLPLNARQYLDLALMTPGALPAATGTQGGGFSVSGARSQSNNFLLDGINNVDTLFDSGMGYFRISDAVQEFALQSNGAAAEFGRGTGGQVNIVTRSGTNQFHGSAFEYFRNSHLDAADFFTNRNRGTKNPLHRNQYGTTIGGPVIKDKLFFFVSWEGFRQAAPVVSTTRVPTAAERASVTDPISKSLLKFWPDANTSVPGSANNFIANASATLFDNTGLARLDYSFTDKDRISVRWTEYDGDTFTPGALALIGGVRNATVSVNGGLTYTYAFSQKLLNEFRIGFSRNDSTSAPQDSGFDASTIFVGANGQPMAGVVRAAENSRDSGCRPSQSAAALLC